MTKEFDSRLDKFFKDYKDPGMRKWQEYSFIGSEIADKLEARRPEMSSQRNLNLLLWAYANHFRVKIQFKPNNNGNCMGDLAGFIDHFITEDDLILAGKLVKIVQISNVKLERIN